MKEKERVVKVYNALKKVSYECELKMNINRIDIQFDARTLKYYLWLFSDMFGYSIPISQELYNRLSEARGLWKYQK